MTHSIRNLCPRGKQRLRVGATPVPHAEILDHVRADLLDGNIDLQIEVLEDFDELNTALAAGRLDANFFQYRPFLADFNRRSAATLVPVVPIHIEPFGVYSCHVGDIEAVPEYAEVALPSDPVNVGRSLAMLQHLGLLECSPVQGRPLAVRDVRANPLRLILKEISGWLLGDVVEDFDLVFLFGYQAVALGVDTRAALCCDRDNPRYAEYLVARHDNHDSEPIRALGAALNSPATREFIATTYAGQLVPAF
ncbi:MetQ/NlpA family ABC transporter substrate-binding protein [Mycobacterium sp. NBC_00419]|uniref:MetQ/NlpA family ABC transporter substrate-binding protein n=1 Tax=Mycobacterium sp. NBC_00419 TaxID=2975989 RepID=UPI002E1C78EC